MGKSKIHAKYGEKQEIGKRWGTATDRQVMAESERHASDGGEQETGE